MKTLLITRGSVITLAAFISACASGPTEHAGLAESRASYEQAIEKDHVVRNGLAHLRKADTALSHAETLLAERKDSEELDHQVYLADRHLAIAREKALRAELEEQRIMAERERDDLRIRLGERRAQIAEMEARMLREQMGRLQAEQTDRGMVMTLGDVLFEFDQAELKPASEETIERLASFMKDYSNYRVRIEGYTDSIGDPDYNQALSLKRAESVRNALLRKGIAPGRMEVAGYGEAFPKASNSTRTGRRENRRVEIVISDSEGNIKNR
ncbi:Outer membrane protein OmpA [Marinobacter daqiaonensis]|uniref:Outer membrane protein OmpA n=1 Tax=Marinobacter daqiaonensis TaxID=650891 RepID=A0A1I6ICL8_9GAMM|nr:OmpA family protein [Marinobacter daqiaonensis]SFR64448.1 Outer membrane protein OmpA [Marinobacter daqiaonensis]